MAFTRDFRETVMERAQRDRKFRRMMLLRGIALLIAGGDDDMQVGKSFIRDYINATVGFPALARRIRIPKQSLMRMFGPAGNPSLSNLNRVTHVLLESEGVSKTEHFAISLRVRDA